MPEGKKKKVPKKIRAKGKNRDERVSQGKKIEQGNKVSVLDTVRDRVGFIEKVKQFLREVKVEYKKVVWPSRKETTNTTIVVIIIVFIIAVFLGVIDMALAKLIRVFIK